MADIEITIPKLGESVIEATIIRWLKQEGEQIAEDEPLVEVATDKVDSEIPSPTAGILKKKLFAEGSVVPVGKAFALLTVTGSVTAQEVTSESVNKETKDIEDVPPPNTEMTEAREGETHSYNRFYSPLVRSIARQENIPFAELDRIPGTGINDRLTKQDMLNYIRNQTAGKVTSVPGQKAGPVPSLVAGGDQVIEMDRIRQLIAAHMVRSVQTSPHVTSFTEADMTNIVRWRDKHKDSYMKREGEKLTYTPVIIEAIAKAVRDYPMMNVSAEGTRILVHKNINIGVAVALPNFNLIVPVIRNADQKSLVGLVRDVNNLADRARSSQLVPDDISGGTISLTNLGSFGTLMGTPIINQPQSAIIATGAIKKRPVVIESSEGDSIAIRYMMILSVTYDHRIIDGALAGQFLNRLTSLLESFNPSQTI